jgi:hypothetical protein
MLVVWILAVALILFNAFVVAFLHLGQELMRGTSWHNY